MKNKKYVVPITKTKTNIFLKSCDSSLAIEKTQFPLFWPSYVRTVHKVQGKKSPEIGVSLNPLKQMYLALSRMFYIY